MNLLLLLCAELHDGRTLDSIYQNKNLLSIPFILPQSNN